MEGAEAQPGAVTAEKEVEVTTSTRLTTVTTTLVHTTEMTTVVEEEEVTAGSSIQEKERDSTSHEAGETEKKVKAEKEEEAEEVYEKVEENDEEVEEAEEDKKDGGEEDEGQEGQHLLKKLMSPWESEVRILAPCAGALSRSKVSEKVSSLNLFICCRPRPTPSLPSQTRPSTGGAACWPVM